MGGKLGSSIGGGQELSQAGFPPPQPGSPGCPHRDLSLGITSPWPTGTLSAFSLNLPLQTWPSCSVVLADPSKAQTCLHLPDAKSFPPHGAQMTPRFKSMICHFTFCCAILDKILSALSSIPNSPPQEGLIPHHKKGEHEKHVSHGAGREDGARRDVIHAAGVWLIPSPPSKENFHSRCHTGVHRDV